VPPETHGDRFLTEDLLAQDDYYYEIQLTNKQLVFYFLAGATLLISSFLLGVMVGRGVDAGGGEVLAAKSVREDRIVPEESPKPLASATPNLTYAGRLEGDKPAEELENPKPTGKPGKPAGKTVASTSGAGKASSRGEESPPPPSADAAPRPAPSPKGPPSPHAAEASPSSASGTFTIQVGAYKDKASAESVVNRLKGKGFAAFVVSPEGADGGLFDVRVGNYASRVDAAKAEQRLRDEEKFKPFIVHQ
jgi:cell division septation protein DedD